MDTAAESREKRPTALKGVFYLLVLVLVGAGLTAFALSLRSEEGPKVPTAEPAPLSVPVETVSLQRQFRLAESYSGLATPRRLSQLGFTSGGRIAALRVDVGDRVSAGQALGVLDTRDLRARLAAAEANVEEAMASYELALTTVDRQRRLRAEGHVSQQRVDEAVASADTAAARVSAASASADTLRVQIDLARITAPFDGMITERMADEGVIAAPGMAVFELVEDGYMEARIGLPAATLSSLEVGADYTLTSDAGDVTATLRGVTGVIDPRQRTVSTIFDVAADGRLPAGSVVRLALDRDIDERGLWLPVTALTESSRGLWAVLVARPDGEGWRADRRLVEIVHTEGDRVYVRGALDDGEQVIIDGIQRITPGQKVTPRDASLAVAAGSGTP